MTEPKERQHNPWMPADYMSGSPRMLRAYLRWAKKSAPSSMSTLTASCGLTAYGYTHGKARILVTPDKLEGEEALFSPEKHLEQLSYVMTNATTTTPKKYEALARKMEEHPHLRVLQDSGGYQLFTEVKEFIDPADVAAAHLKLPKGVREGVGLDLPLGFGYPSSTTTKRAARFQIDNNKRIRDAGYGGPLFFTSHGRYADTRISYLEEIMKKDDSSTKYLTIAALRGVLGLYNPTAEQVAAQTIYILESAKPKRVHLLGLASAFSFFLCSELRKRYPEIKVTMDSATYLLMAAGGRWLTTSLAHRSQGPKVPTPEPINCCCELCIAMGRYYSLSAMARGELPKVHNLNSQVMHGTLSDPVLEVWETLPEFADVMRILWARGSEVERNLWEQCAPPKAKTSLFKMQNHVSKYEARLNFVMDTYRSRLKSGI